MQELKSLIENFSKAKILIVGDVMLDRYWSGSVTRISPEAPVAVVNLQKKKLVAGGAANVAANVAGLGAEPFLVGVIGKDEEGAEFPALLKSVNISADYLVKLPDRPTTVKTRIVAHNQHIVRLDQEEKKPLSAQQEKIVLQKIEQIFNGIDLIIVSDYAKGLLTKNLLARLITLAKEKRKKILVDPKGKDYSKYKGATLLTPNRREAAESCKLEEDGENLIRQAGKLLLEDLNLEALIITQGEDGMTLFEKEKVTAHFPASAREVYDVTGAGDTVISTLGVALASGLDLKTSVNLANIAAGIVVGHFGTTAISLKELRKTLEN